MYIYIHIYNLLCSSLFGNKFYFILNKESNKLLEQTLWLKTTKVVKMYSLIVLWVRNLKLCLTGPKSRC